MRHGILSTTLAITLAPFFCHAQSTVFYGAGLGQRNVLDITGQQALTDNNAVWVGVFDSGFDVAANSGNLVALDSAWNNLIKDTTETLFATSGLFGGDASTSDPSFDNSQIWFWVFQTSDNGTPDASFSNVMGYGLYSGSDANWRLPAQGVAPPSDVTYVYSDQVNMAYHGSYDDNHLILQPVPEPSTWGMIFVGLGCLTIHLWRKQPPNPFRR